MPKDIFFRIAWSSLVNDTSGNGQYCLSFDEARDYVRKLNEKYKGEVRHWCEASPNANPSKNTQTDSEFPVYEASLGLSALVPLASSVSAPLPQALSSSSPSLEEPFHQPQ